METVLSELQTLLPGCNYVVHLAVFRAPLMSGATAEQYVSAALGAKAVVGATFPVTAEELVAKVEECLCYVGDRSAGPKPSVLRSQRFKKLLRSVKENLQRSAAEASVVEGFWLKQGHPFYPVMWDFAFVFVKHDGAEIFIGSGSD